MTNKIKKTYNNKREKTEWKQREIDNAERKNIFFLKTRKPTKQKQYKALGTYKLCLK